MSRRNYMHTMDALIHGYSNAIGDGIVTERIVEPIPATQPISADTLTTLHTVASPTYTNSMYDDGGSRTNTVYTRPEVTPTPYIGSATNDENGLIERRIAEAQRLAQIEAEKQASLNNPIIVVPTPFVAPPLVVGGGGGGGSMGERPKPSAPTVSEPSFLKKNFIPLLLVATAIYVFIKKPIK